MAEDCADLAPDGVVRLTGYRRTASDLLHDLFAAVYKSDLYRPEREELLQLVHEIGAVVVLDDVEFGGSALDELLDATPECAFLISATPDVPAPSADSLLEEVVLGGLDRAGGLELLERAVGRVLTEDESNWAGDLWFESEGLPLRFMQAGALLRQRDELRADPNAFDSLGFYDDAPSPRLSAALEPGDTPGAPSDAEDGHDLPLPSLAEGAAPASLLASRLSASARETLKFAVALGGEVPHQTHLPALVDDTHADAALAELLSCALVSPVGSRYRLAAGVQAQLEAAGFATGADARALAAAQHYAWWAGHPSVTPERVSAEADAVLAALTVLVPLTTPPGENEESAAVLLARQPPPRSPRGCTGAPGSERCAPAPRRPGSPARSATRPTSTTNWASSRSAAASSTGPAPSWRPPSGCAAPSPTSAARSRAAAPSPWSPTAPGRYCPAGARRRARRCRTRATRSRRRRPAGYRPASDCPRRPVTARPWSPTGPSPRPPAGPGRVKGLVGGARRNLVAAGAGALLAAVLGTVVTLGTTSNNNDNPPEKVGVNPSASQGNRRRQPRRGQGEEGHAATTGAAGAPDRPGSRRHLRHVRRPDAAGQHRRRLRTSPSGTKGEP